MTEKRAPSLTLLENSQALEAAALGMLLPNGSIANLVSMPWEKVGTAYKALWRDFVLEYTGLLEGYTAAGLPELLQQIPRLASQMRDPKGMLLTREQRADRAVRLLATSLSLALADHGWEIRSQPGNFGFLRGGEKLVPHDLVALVSQTLQ